MGKHILWILVFLCLQSLTVSGVALDLKVRHHLAKRCAPESIECCRFPMRTQPFDECCQKYGCCPICEDVEVRPCNVTLAASECCAFQQPSDEFNECCNTHGCCPLCDGVSVINCDVQAAKIECCPLENNTAAMNTCCTKHGCCPLCDGCVDENGVYHDDMTGWMDPHDPCLVYSCFQGVISEHINHHCDGCYDEHDIYHDSMTGWIDPTDPCIRHYCANRIITSEVIDCEEPTCDNPVVPQGECCPSCNGCYHQGQYYESMTGWADPYNPCVYYRCLNGKIEVHVRDCPPVECQYPIQRSCECCPYCIPDDCHHDGHYHDHKRDYAEVNVHVNQNVINEK